MGTLSGTGQIALNFLYWGFVIATVLLGFTVIQSFIYFSNYKDNGALRLLVVSLIALDFLSSALMAHVIHYYMIQNYGNAGSLASPPPVTFPIEYLTTGIVAFLSEMFYASQIYKLRTHSHQCLVPFLIMVFFAIFALLSNIVATIIIMLWSYSPLHMSTAVLKIFTSIGNCFAAVCDIVACSALCTFLASHRVDIGRSRTTFIDTLMFYTVNRGILFSITQLGHMIAYISAPSSLYWVPFHLCVCKLYVNSVLALLNSRKSLRGAAQDISRIDFHIDPPPPVSPAAQKSRSSFVRPLELRHLEDSTSSDEDDKLGTPAPKAAAISTRMERNTSL